MKDDISYQDAMDELKQIQQSLQSAPEDLDEMIIKVRRADQLIKYCREKLEGARSVVRDILEEE